MRHLLLLLYALLQSLAACSAALPDTSVELDASKLRTLLEAVQRHITKGFGEPEFARIEKDFRALKNDETKQYVFPITYNGADTELRVLVRKEDFDAIVLHFAAMPKLTEAIKQSIRTTPLDVTP